MSPRFPCACEPRSFRCTLPWDSSSSPALSLLAFPESLRRTSLVESKFTAPPSLFPLQIKDSVWRHTKTLSSVILFTVDRCHTARRPTISHSNESKIDRSNSVVVLCCCETLPLISPTNNPSCCSYWKLPSASMLSNFMGVFLILFGGIVIYLVSRHDYRRVEATNGEQVGFASMD